MNTATDFKFTDDLERQMIFREIDALDHDEEAGLSDRVLKPLLLISVSVGVPLVTYLIH